MVSEYPTVCSVIVFSMHNWKVKFKCYRMVCDKIISKSIMHDRTRLLSTPMGVDYVVIGFDMEVQPLVTHNAA